MQFVPYHQLDGRPHLVLDGSPTGGTVLCVTHWPGYPPPRAVAADLSAQMAFLLRDHPDLWAGVELVSNNHFDQDGTVAIHALVDPASAVPNRALLEDVAAAGDFAVYRDRRAARISMVLSAFADGRSNLALPDDYPGRCAVLYTEVLGRLHELCADVEPYRELWGDEDATLTASEAAIDGSAVSITEHADVDLAVVDVPPDAPSAGGHRFGGDWEPGLHPMAVHNATDRLVVATIRGRGYQVEERYETWVQLQSRPARRRRDLLALAARLQDEERGDAVWTATPVSGLVPMLRSGEGDSSIERDRFVAIVAAHLRTAPPAWDPFTPVG